VCVENSTEVPASWVESLSLEERQQIQHQGRITWARAVREYPDKIAAWLLSRGIGKSITQRQLKYGSAALKGIGVTAGLKTSDAMFLHEFINRGEMAQNTASSEQSEAEGNKRKNQVPPTTDTRKGKKARNNTAHGQSETCGTKLPACELSLASRWKLVCVAQNEWAGAGSLSRDNAGENVGVKKLVMREKLARLCSDILYSAPLPRHAYDQFDPPGTIKEWNSPQIRVHDTLLYITHVESVSGDPSLSSLHQQLTRRLDILVGGQLQRGMTQKKNTRSKAENIFTPMVLGIHSSRLTGQDKKAVKMYLSAFIGILWTSAEVRKTI